VCSGTQRSFQLHGKCKQESGSGQLKHKRYPTGKTPKTKRTEGVAQVVECPCSKQESLSSNPTTAKTPKHSASPKHSEYG
jgi:hypothetical protein